MCTSCTGEMTTARGGAKFGTGGGGYPNIRFGHFCFIRSDKMYMECIEKKKEKNCIHMIYYLQVRVETAAVSTDGIKPNSSS